MRTEITFFNETSESYRDEYRKVTPEGYSFRVRREKVLDMLPEGNGKHILDLASGPGVMIKGLRAKNYRVTCVDAAPEMIEFAKQEASGDPLVTCEVGDAYSLHFADKTFDIVTAMGLIEYLEDEHRYLTETRRILVDHGVAIITFPNLWSPWRLWNRLLRSALHLVRPSKRAPLLHREYTVAHTRELLAKTHLQLEEVQYYNFKLMPFPLDRLFPRATVAFSKICEHLDRTPLRFLGTAFIVKARAVLE